MPRKYIQGFKSGSQHAKKVNAGMLIDLGRVSKL
jgi:hypothetical protein